MRISLKLICYVYHFQILENMAALLRTLAVLAMVIVMVNGMGLCFGGGYPKCCENGKNSCGPFCASCSRVMEFLRHMNMFDMMGFSMGTPAVFRIINNNGLAKPGQPVPTNFNRSPRTSQ